MNQPEESTPLCPGRWIPRREIQQGSAPVPPWAKASHKVTAPIKTFDAYDLLFDVRMLVQLALDIRRYMRKPVVKGLTQKITH